MAIGGLRRSEGIGLHGGSPSGLGGRGQYGTVERLRAQAASPSSIMHPPDLRHTLLLPSPSPPSPHPLPEHPLALTSEGSTDDDNDDIEDFKPLKKH